MESFSNSMIIPEELPEIKEHSFKPLHKKQLQLILIREALLAFLMMGAYAFILFVSENIPKTVIVTMASILILIIVMVVLLTVLAFPKKGYLLREQDISFQRGLITYKVTTVPFNRIQHVEVNQGVIAKILRLSTLKLYTAGGSSSDLSIHGIQEDEAQNMKAFLLGKISELQHKE